MVHVMGPGLMGVAGCALAEALCCCVACRGETTGGAISASVSFPLRSNDWLGFAPMVQC